MRGPAEARGSSAAEYLGLVAAIGLAIGGLLAVREHVGGRTAPVRPIPVVVRLLGAPAELLRRPAPPRRTQPAAVVPPPVRRSRVTPARRPPAPPRPVLLLPEWLTGVSRGR